uniref:Uncharacterized protein n=1 Tax=Lotus japonicus TaxID=34305 RepID=I3SKE9_LOTJA|nr:unknown [Lotus japonicus]
MQSLAQPQDPQYPCLCRRFSQTLQDHSQSCSSPIETGPLPAYDLHEDQA